MGVSATGTSSVAATSPASPTDPKNDVLDRISDLLGNLPADRYFAVITRPENKNNQVHFRTYEVPLSNLADHALRGDGVSLIKDDGQTRPRALGEQQTSQGWLSDTAQRFTPGDKTVLEFEAMAFEGKPGQRTASLNDLLRLERGLKSYVKSEAASRPAPAAPARPKSSGGWVKASSPNGWRP